MRLLILTLLICGAAVGASAQTVWPTAEQNQAKSELTEGAQAYKAGRFVEAQQHFEKAFALDPTLKNTRFFIARAIQSQFRPSDQSPENVAKAREAIAAYQLVLAEEPSNDLAYSSIVYLYGAIGEDALQRDLLMRRATDASVPAEKRAQAYVVLASKEWNCSYTVTERSENKRTVIRQSKVILRYVKPKEQSEFEQARQCATRGLELVERAISLDSENEQAWAYKTNLLLEMGKLAEMDSNKALKSDYQQQADEAQKRTTELSERNRKKKEAEEQKKAEEEKLSPPA
jgi:tetratricopeptide (TPR) repeat protein